MVEEENKYLTERFHSYFKTQLAESEKQKEDVYRIRYRVYCDEFKFLKESDYEGELEKDAYDDHSPSLLITHRKTGMPAACVRLVLGFRDGQPQKMPFELLSENIIDQEVMESFGTSRQSTAEISRLAVDGAFRRRSGEAATRFGEIDALDIEQSERRTFGLISVAAFLGAAALGDMYGQKTGVAMMEPFLPRLMERSGIVFRQIGPEIDYHGKRAPYLIELESMLYSIGPGLGKFYQAIRAELGQTE